MSFFEPLPPRQPPAAHQWVPPAWDRLSEGTLPAILPVNEVVHRSDAAVVELELLRVYPNGFTINLLILMDPHDTETGRHFGMGAGVDPAQRFPRIGARFSDGREVGRGATFPFFPGVASGARDDRGFPTEPVLTMIGGGGGSGGYHFGAWVFPLPPEGPLDIYVSLPTTEDAESKVTIDGGKVRELADQAQIVWT